MKKITEKILKVSMNTIKKCTNVYHGAKDDDGREPMHVDMYNTIYIFICKIYRSSHRYVGEEEQIIVLFILMISVVVNRFIHFSCLPMPVHEVHFIAA